MSHIKQGSNLERLAPDAMDLDSLVDTSHCDVISIGDDDPMPHPQILPDQYCFMCGTGDELVMCDKCSRAICIGPNAQCLRAPVTSCYKNPEVSFICPPCHQDDDRKTKKPRPYYGFYVFPSPPDKTQTWTSGKPFYDSPAEVRGSAQLIPRSKFLSNGIAILNFRVRNLDVDGGLGKVLEPFAAAFFPKETDDLLIFEDIVYDFSQDLNQDGHKRKTCDIVERLRAASLTLRTVIILITTHAADGTGYLATSSSCYVDINEWMSKVVTKPILDIICTLDAHWFFLCCGALVHPTSSFERIKSFANKWKPTNLFAFDAPTFRPIYAATFLLNFFQYIIIEGRTFDSAVGLLLNASALSRHAGVVRFWTRDSVVRSCTLRWTHSRTQPWGRSVPYQCPSCHCIQVWGQKGHGASSEVGRDVTMRCSYKGVNGQCPECLTFEKPSVPYKTLKQSEGVWVAFDVEKSDFL